MIRNFQSYVKNPVKDNIGLKKNDLPILLFVDSIKILRYVKQVTSLNDLVYKWDNGKFSSVKRTDESCTCTRLKKSLFLCDLLLASNCSDYEVKDKHDANKQDFSVRFVNSKRDESFRQITKILIIMARYFKIIILINNTQNKVKVL